MLSALIAVLTNPAVDSAIAAAGQELVALWNSLSAEQQQQLDAQVTALMLSITTQLSEADADLAAAQQQVSAIVAATPNPMAVLVAAVKAQLSAK